MRNKILTSIIGIFALFFIMMMTSCGMDINLNSGNERSFKGSSDWMSKISDDALIRKMTIPGTHDTCAQHDFIGLSSTAAAQDLSLSELLEAGIRQIDIRPYNDGSDIKIHHGITYQYINYNAVVNICYDFIERHPTETILFMVLPEYKSKDADILDAVKSTIEANPSKWADALDATDLTLGQCRGKLVLVKRFNGLEGEYGIPRGSGKGQLHQLDDYKTRDLEKYWAELYQHLNAMKNSVDPNFSVVWSSGYFEGQFGIPNIRIVSSCINPKMEAYFDGAYDGIDKKYTQSHFGIIGMDHATRRLIYKIYRVNFAGATDDEETN